MIMVYFSVIWSNQGKTCDLLDALSCIRLFVTPWTVAHHAFLSMEFSRQEYWSGLPFPLSM